MSAGPCPGAYDLGPIWAPAPVHEDGCCERWAAEHRSTPGAVSADRAVVVEELAAQIVADVLAGPAVAS